MSPAHRALTAAGVLADALIEAIEHAGWSVSGPTHWPAAEHGEPRWVCKARATLAQATALTGPKIRNMST